jgi:eukaryotic-like serine/threonine-protein kinase
MAGESETPAGELFPVAPIPFCLASILAVCSHILFVREPEFPMPVTLTVIAGPEAGRELHIQGRDTFLAGRAAECHFRPGYDDPYIAPRHFLIDVRLPRCRLIDLNTKSGTKVNGQKVAEKDLVNGDELRAGQSVLRVTFPPDVPAGKGAPATAEMPAMADLPAVPKTAPQIEGYEPENEIGRGALGKVYRGKQTSDDSRVAIRTIRPAPQATPEDINRFLFAMHKLESLRHPLIVGVLGSGLAGNRPYIVSEFVIGPSAHQFVAERGPVAVRAAVLMMIQALEGLAHAHAEGFVHGNVKPSNLLIGKYGDKRRVKIAEFGLARAFDESNLGGRTLLGEVPGSMAFIAPEQLSHVREAKPAADQYSAAATLYYLLTAKHIYDLPEGAVPAIARILSAEPLPIMKRREDIPEPLAKTIHKALSREPAARFADINAFRQALIDGPGGS